MPLSVSQPTYPLMFAKIVPIPAAARDPLPADAVDTPSTLDAPSNFLAQLDADGFAGLVAIATLQRYAKGDFVFRAGAPAGNVYFLRSGKVKIHQLPPVGREVILWFCFPGEIFGLAEVASGGGRVVTIDAQDGR